MYQASGVSTNMMPMYYQGDFDPRNYNNTFDTTNHTQQQLAAANRQQQPQQYSQLPSYSSHSGSTMMQQQQQQHQQMRSHPSAYGQTQLLGAPAHTVNRVSPVHTAHMGFNAGGLGQSGAGLPQQAPAPSAQGAATAPQQLYRNLYVSGLPVAVNDDDLKEVFGQFGKIESAKVMIDVSTGMSRGFAFVLFSKVEEGCAAFGSLNGKDVTIKGETFKMKMMPSEHDGRQASQPTPIIYVRNLPAGASETMVRLHFERFGEVVSFSMRPIPNNLGASGNLGHSAADGSDTLYLATVEFRTTEGASLAIEGTHNKKIFDCCLHPVLAKFADTQEMKDAKKAKRVQQVGGGINIPGHNVSVGMPSMAVGVNGQPMSLPNGPMQILMSQNTAAMLGGVGQPKMGGSVSQHPIMMMTSTNSTHNTPMATASTGPAYPQATQTFVPPFYQSGSIPQNPISQFTTPQQMHQDSSSSPVPFGASAPSSTKVQYSTNPTPMNGAAPSPSSYLPLPPRIGEQVLVYFQGLLMKTPDGLLVPAHVEHCQYVDGPSSSFIIPPHSPAGGQAPTMAQQHLQPQQPPQQQQLATTASAAPMLLSVSFQQQQFGAQPAPNEAVVGYGGPGHSAVIGSQSRNVTPVAVHTSTPPSHNNNAPSSSSSCTGQRVVEVGQLSDCAGTTEGSVEGGNGSMGGAAPSMWTSQQLVGAVQPSTLAPTSPFLYQ